MKVWAPKVLSVGWTAVQIDEYDRNHDVTNSEQVTVLTIRIFLNLVSSLVGGRAC